MNSNRMERKHVYVRGGAHNGDISRIKGVISFQTNISVMIVIAYSFHMPQQRPSIV